MKKLLVFLLLIIVSGCCGVRDVEKEVSFNRDVTVQSDTVYVYRFRGERTEPPVVVSGERDTVYMNKVTTDSVVIYRNKVRRDTVERRDSVMVEHTQVEYRTPPAARNTIIILSIIVVVMIIIGLVVMRLR